MFGDDPGHKRTVLTLCLAGLLGSFPGCDRTPVHLGAHDTGGEAIVRDAATTKRDTGTDAMGLFRFDSRDPRDYRAARGDMVTNVGSWTSKLDEIRKQLNLGSAPFGATAVWGSGKNNVYMLGPDGGIIHYNGTRWKVVHVQTGLNAIWGSGPSDIFAVGNAEGSVYSRRAIIVHYDGKAWKTMTPSLAGADLKAVWGSGPKDVWAVGDKEGARQCVFLHYNGTNWTSASPAVQPTVDADAAAHAGAHRGSANTANRTGHCR